MQHWLDKLTDLTAIQVGKSIVKHARAKFLEHVGFNSLDRRQIALTRAVGAYVVPFTISLQAA